MLIVDMGLEEFEMAEMDDAWYELEGAYEVYGIGRCRFVLVHCRAAMLIGMVLLAKSRGLSISEMKEENMEWATDMPDNLREWCQDIDTAGRFGYFLKEGLDDQERAANILSRTLEVFEWIRKEMDNFQKMNGPPD
jgi:hypothetical protein